MLVQPLREQVVGTVRPALLIVFAAAASVLALACFNLANLLTARGITRQRELAVRAALGAGRLRLLQQTLTEGFVIAFLGGAAGLALGMWTVRAFVALFNETRYFSLPRRAEIAFDWRVFVFVSILCIATALLFSLAPAVRAMKADAAPSMRRPDSRSERRWRSMLMSGELAIALMLVVACVQLVGSYTRLQNQESGFQSNDLLTARIAQRSREIAIRIALGGSRRAIVALLLRPMSALCVSGVAVGLLLSVALARGLSSLLYAVTPVDPIAFGAASIGFLTVAVAAGGWTAYRTTNIQPVALLIADS